MDKGQPPPYTPHANMPMPQPPPAGFVPPPTMGPQVVVTTVPTIITPLGPESQVITCPYCHHQISTTVTSEPSTKTHLFALLLCLFVCWPCCCLPYCMDSCQNRNHTCPHCKAFLGSYES